MLKANILRALLAGKKRKNKSFNLIFTFLTGGTFFFLIILIAIIFFLIFLPFVGIFFFTQVNKEADASKNAAGAQLSTIDPMDNQGFVQDLLKSIEYGENWQDILAAVQSKRMIYNSEKVSIEEAAAAVLAGNVEAWLQNPPQAADPNILKNMQQDEFKRTLSHNQRSIRYHIGPYVGRKNIESIQTIPLNGGEVQQWKYEPNMGYLSFEVVAKDGTRKPYALYGVIEAKVYPDLSSAEQALKDNDLARKYANQVVILQSTKDPSGELGIIVNFPLDRGIKIEDEDLISAIGLISDMSDLTKAPNIPLGQTPEEAGMATYIKTNIDTPVVVPENVKVINVYINPKTKGWSVILQSLDNERRYKFENLSRLAMDCVIGKIYVSHPGGSIVFGYTGTDASGKGLLKMNTYVNFKLIFKEDVEENPEGLNHPVQQPNTNTSLLLDPAASDGFYEVDSYKAALIMKESRVNTSPQQEEINKIFPPDNEA